MEPKGFRRSNEGMTSRMSATELATTPIPPRSSGSDTVHPSRSSTTTLSPRPSFHAIASPSPSTFSIFSRLQTPFRPNEQIIEVDEASTNGLAANSRRYSSIIGSPANSATRDDPTKSRRSSLHRRSSLQFTSTARPSDKFRHKPWFALGFGWRPRRSHWRRLWFWSAAVGIFLVAFALVIMLPEDLQPLAPVVIGSLLSFISSVTILVSYLLQPQNRRYPNELLVYVAICEVGLAVLALVHVMAYCSDSSTCQAMTFEACTSTTALKMFLLLASVGWFGCAILHLFVSVSNPFANYKSQLKRYHITVWGGSIVVSLVVPLVVFSRSSQSRYEMSGVEICRAVSLHFPLLPTFASESDRDLRLDQWQTVNMEYWGTLFFLVVSLVIAAQFILAVGWWRSNSGTVIALKARRRMMQRMTTYVHTLNATWLVLLVVFFWYRADPGALRHLAALSTATNNPLGVYFVKLNVLDAVFHFVLAAKGYFTCVVWLAVNKHGCALGSILCGRGGLPDDGSDDDDDDDEDDVDPDGSGRETNQLTWSAASFRSHGGGRGASRHTPSRIPSRGSTRHAPALRPSATGGPSPSVSFSAGASSMVSNGSSSAWASQNNETLQREIIYYTVCGITKAILRSAQNPDTDVFFQQMMVGADRESSLTTHSMSSQSPGGEYPSSPRAYCQPHPGTSFTGANTSISSSVGPSISFTAANTSIGGRFRLPSEDAVSNLSSSFVSQTSTTMTPPRTTHPRGSMYPVSQVPFELFEQEIELQSHRSSLGSNGFSPALFASIRRTATALYNQPKGRGVDDPRPKMFIDYAPTEFRAIRRAFGLSDEMYLASFRSTAKERVSAGSSGAFMFFSGDNALIVKSMKEKECRKLVTMIPAYADYITGHPESRIIRFFGCHRIRLYGRNFYFVVMSNVLHSLAHTPTITEKYDVKGSWVDRRARLPVAGDHVTCSECNATYEFGRGDASTTPPFHVHRPDTILKDLDLQRPLHLGKGVTRALYAQLVMDCEFLHSMGIMDYSLLVGVHKCSHPEESWQREFRTSMSFLAAAGGGRGSNNSNGSSNGKSDDDAGGRGRGVSPGAHLEPIPECGDDPEEMYFIGIIDILQEWTWEKQLEKVGKMLIGKSSEGISAVAPAAYCRRFQARVAEILRLHEPSHADADTHEIACLRSQPSLRPMTDDHLEFRLQEDTGEDDDNDAMDADDMYRNPSESAYEIPWAGDDDDEDDDEEAEADVDNGDELGRSVALPDPQVQFDAEAEAAVEDLELGIHGGNA